MFIRVHPWLILFALTAAPCAQLSLPAASAPTGSSLLLPISFASQSASVTAIQFDLQYDPAVLSLTATPGDTARAAGKSLYLWQLYPGLWRFFIVGLNQTAFADGALVNLFAVVSPVATPDTYPVQLLNIVASDPSAQPVTVTEPDGSLAVQGTADPASILQSWGVLNAASLLPSAVAPGEIVTLFGAALSPTGVLFDGAPAPILYAGPGQINLIAPFAFQNKSTTELQVMQASQPVAQLQLPVVAASPAIFTADGSGTGPGAILNQDYTLNTPSTPAAKGSVIMIFANGAGQIDPAAPYPQPVLPVSVRIAGQPAQILYAGAAPGLISGVLQVNCLIPPTAPSGWSVPITLAIGTFVSPDGVTLSIRTPDPTLAEPQPQRPSFRTPPPTHPPPAPRPLLGQTPPHQPPP